MSEYNPEELVDAEVALEWPRKLLKPTKARMGSRSGQISYYERPARPVKEQWIDFEIERNSRPNGISSYDDSFDANAQDETFQDVYERHRLFDRNIRLLQIDRAKHDHDQLHCTLKTVYLNGKPPAWFALSYCWGTGGRTAPLSCNNGTVMISPSLLKGLILLRDHPDTCDQYFWIDQICVNQDDLRERAGQVAMMDQIYRKATRVVIWLHVSDDYPENEEGFRLARSIFHSPAISAKKQGTLEGLDEFFSRFKSTDVPDMVSFELPPVTRPSWLELSSILNHPWFTRVWVIQEAVLARADPILFYGSTLRDWRSLLFAGAWLSQLGPAFTQSIDLSDTNAIALKFLHRICRSGKEWTLSGLLRQTNYALATDPRDKVFAMLQISRNFEMSWTTGRVPARRWITPRYDEHHTKRHVYTAAVRYCIYHENSLLPLSSVNYDRDCHAEDALPSWVPDFTVQRPIISHPFVASCGTSTFDPFFKSASNALPVHAVADRGSPYEIKLEGVQVDVVQSVVTGKGLMSWHSEAGAECQKWHLQKHTEERPKDTDSMFSRNFREVLAASAALPTPTIKELDAYLRKESNCTSHLMLQLEDYHSEGTKLFLTEKGNLGVGPEYAKQGDIICVLFGGRVPFVLRTCHNHFHLVGECYDAAWMSGMAVEMLEKGELERQWFLIK